MPVVTSRSRSFWDGKVAIVTGGSSGLGLAIGQALFGAGASVVLVARNEGKLREAQEWIRSQESGDGSQKSGERLIAVSADVTSDAEVARCIAEVVGRFQRIDVLVNCAGISMRGEVLRTPPEEFLRLFDLNFVSMVRMVQAAAPQLIQSQGSIVNIGSLASKSASRYLGAYPASKFPVAALCQQLRLELAPQGVHTLLVCPGPIRRSDATERYAAQANDLPAGASQPGGGVQLKGIEPAELAAMILRACERRQLELIVPWRAKLLFAISQLWPRLGDWLVLRFTRQA